MIQNCQAAKDFMMFTSNSLNLILLPNIFNLKILWINNMEMQT